MQYRSGGFFCLETHLIYVYRCACGTTYEEIFPMGKAPRFITVDQHIYFTASMKEGEAGLCAGGEATRYYKGETKRTNISSLNRDIDPSLILPSAKNFESKDDPDGSKGMAQWLDNFEPAPGNKNPAVPKMPAGTKKTYTTASSVKNKEN